MISRASWALVAALGLLFGGGCGGKVVFDGGAGGGGGAGGSTASGSAECVLGLCGDLCTKCVGTQCVNGKCDMKGTCQPPDVTFTCGK